jgi:hypothetical protein
MLLVWLPAAAQVASIWNEVLVQQAADGHNAATMQRLTNFDLRHTAASSGAPLSSPAAGGASPSKLPGVAQAAAIFDSSSPPPGEMLGAPA